jgi:hypothetical protein
MKLIEEWRNCWKYLSVQANSVGVAITATYASLYEQLKENLPPRYMMIAVVLVFVLGIAGRLIVQTPKDGPQ